MKRTPNKSGLRIIDATTPEARKRYRELLEQQLRDQVQRSNVPVQPAPTATPKGSAQ